MSVPIAWVSERGVTVDGHISEHPVCTARTQLCIHTSPQTHLPTLSIVIHWTLRYHVYTSSVT